MRQIEAGIHSILMGYGFAHTRIKDNDIGGGYFDIFYSGIRVGYVNCGYHDVKTDLITCRMYVIEKDNHYLPSHVFDDTDSYVKELMRRKEEIDNA